jgi:hypothetical protein
MRMYKYDDIRSEIRSGDRIEFAGKSIVGRLIRFFDKQTVNHTALALSIDEYTDHPGNRKFILEANAGGIELNTLSGAMKNADGLVYWTPLTSEYYHCRNAIADWALQNVGVKYDFGNLFKNAFARVNADIRKMFCSEYYFCALVAGGCLPGYVLKGYMVVDAVTGKPVKAPRPGEFGKYKIFGETTEIIL